MFKKNENDENKIKEFFWFLCFGIPEQITPNINLSLRVSTKRDLFEKKTIIERETLREYNKGFEIYCRFILDRYWIHLIFSYLKKFL